MLADRIGRAALEDRWRDRALEPDAKARWRILAEFVWYLEHHRLAMTEALTSDDAEIFRHAGRVYERLDALLTAVTPLSRAPRRVRRFGRRTRFSTRTSAPDPAIGSAASRMPTSVLNLRPMPTGWASSEAPARRT